MNLIYIFRIGTYQKSGYQDTVSLTQMSEEVETWTILMSYFNVTGNGYAGHSHYTRYKNRKIC
jgi:hypothetical protein